MTVVQRRYVRIEMIVGAVINAVISIVFVMIVFGGHDRIPVEGSGGLIIDSVPQTLLIALMSMIVPTLLTRRRVVAGRVAPLPPARRYPRNVLIRSLVTAVIAAAVAWIAHAVAMPLTGSTWSFTSVALFKPMYGALLGAAMSRFAVIAALADQG